MLSLPFLQLELFQEGINDVVPVGLLLLAFALRARGGRTGAALSGVALGLSIGAKLLPGGLLAVPLILARKDRRSLVAAVAAVDGRVVWAHESGELLAVRLGPGASAWRLYRHGALLVGNSSLTAGCLSWMRS